MGEAKRGEKLDRAATRRPPRCPMCGHPLELVWVHGHGQCARCGMDIDSCCEGAPLPTGEERGKRGKGEGGSGGGER